MLYKNSKRQIILRSILVLACLIMCVTQIFIIVAALAADTATTQPSETSVELATPEAEAKAEAKAEAEIPQTLVAVLLEKPILFTELEYKTFYDINLDNEHLSTLLDSSEILQVAISSGEYSADAVTAMIDEHARLQGVMAKIQVNINKYTAWEQEYYYAAKTYEFLKQKGYNDAVACGIIGNMMIETSGGTLALKPIIYDPAGDFYGLCQWSLYYRPDVADMPFEEQLDYLYSDIEKEFDVFGFCYARGFTYEDFLDMTDPAEAALAFAKVYERCASFSYAPRAWAANSAYEYFTGE